MVIWLHNEVKRLRSNRIQSSGGNLGRVNPRALRFVGDFATGFVALMLIGLTLLIIIPLLLLVLKVGAVLILPVALLGAGIILIALFGRLIRVLVKRW